MDPKLQARLKDLDAMASDLDETKKLVRALFYGDFGVGKTTLAGAIAKIVEPYEGKRDICLVTTDSAYSVLTADEELKKRIKRYPFDSYSQIRMIALAHAEGIEPYVSYRTLIWDTVTTSNDEVLRDLVSRQKFEKDQRHPELEAYPHYRMSANALKEVVKALKNTDMHVIYTAHVKFPNEQDKSKNKFAIRPNAPEMAYNVVGQEVNLIGWLFKEKEGREYVRKIQTTGTKEETAKSQIPTIPETILNQSEIPSLISQWMTG